MYFILFNNILGIEETDAGEERGRQRGGELRERSRHEQGSSVLRSDYVSSSCGRHNLDCKLKLSSK